MKNLLVILLVAALGVSLYFNFKEKPKDTAVADDSRFRKLRSGKILSAFN